MEHLVTAADLAEQQRRLDAEAEQITADIGLMRQRADSLGVAAALAGTPAPDEADELRQRADAGERRLEAIAEAKRLIDQAQHERQQIANRELSAAHAERVHEAKALRAAAFKGLGDALRNLQAQLAAVREAADHHDAMVRHARAMAQQGVMTGEELSPLLPVRVAPPAGVRMQDRKTGAIRPEYRATRAQLAEAQREMFETAALKLARSEIVDPEILERFAFLEAAVAEAGADLADVEA